MGDCALLAPVVPRPWLRLLLLAAFLIGFYVLGRATGLTQELTVDGIREWMLVAGPAGFGVFVLTFVAAQLLYVPGFVFVAVAGLVYGPIWGPIASVLAATISVAVSFAVVRGIGGQPLQYIQNPLFRRWLDRLDQEPLRSMILIRLFFWAMPPVNYALAMSNVGFRDYMVAAVIGLTPPFVALSAAFGLGFDLL